MILIILLCVSGIYNLVTNYQGTYCKSHKEEHGRRLNEEEKKEVSCELN